MPGRHRGPRAPWRRSRRRQNVAAPAPVGRDLGPADVVVPVVRGAELATGGECVDLALRAFLLSVSAPDCDAAYWRVSAFLATLDDEAVRTVAPHLAMFPAHYFGRLDDQVLSEAFLLEMTWSRP